MGSVVTAKKYFYFRSVIRLPNWKPRDQNRGTGKLKETVNLAVPDLPMVGAIDYTDAYDVYYGMVCPTSKEDLIIMIYIVAA